MLGKGWFPDTLGGLDRYFRCLLEQLPDATAVVIGPVSSQNGRVVSVSRQDAPLTRRLIAFWRAAQDQGHASAVVDAHFALYSVLPTMIGSLRHKPLMVHFQ